MSEFLFILKEYKDTILTALAVVLSLIAILVKRKPKTIDDFKFVLADVLNYVPALVKSVERPNDGALKKEEVIRSASLLVKKALGRNLTMSESNYVRTEVSKQIEDVLTTPQKKVIC